MKNSESNPPVPPDTPSSTNDHNVEEDPFDADLASKISSTRETESHPDSETITMYQGTSTTDNTSTKTRETTFAPPTTDATLLNLIQEIIGDVPRNDDNTSVPRNDTNLEHPFDLNTPEGSEFMISDEDTAPNDGQGQPTPKPRDLSHQPPTQPIEVEQHRTVASDGQSTNNNEDAMAQDDDNTEDTTRAEPPNPPTTPPAPAHLEYCHHCDKIFNKSSKHRKLCINRKVHCPLNRFFSGKYKGSDNDIKCRDRCKLEHFGEHFSAHSIGDTIDVSELYLVESGIQFKVQLFAGELIKYKPHRQMYFIKAFNSQVQQMGLVLALISSRNQIAIHSFQMIRRKHSSATLKIILDTPTPNPPIICNKTLPSVFDEGETAFKLNEYSVKAFKSILHSQYLNLKVQLLNIKRAPH